ncbi:hypothetical protein GCM10011428_33970 [Streptomyces violaceus]|uniref:hypothetical protein n=1 Tax=Streptomyces violaceus TaxID=1936 RepID=UPI0031F1A418
MLPLRHRPAVLAAVLIDRDELDEAQALLDEAAVSHPLVDDPVVQAAGRSPEGGCSWPEGTPGPRWRQRRTRPSRRP